MSSSPAIYSEDIPLHIYQFKNHTSTRVLLRDGIHMLIGDNGAGKSTLCEACTVIINAMNPHATSWKEKATFGTRSWSLRLIGETPLSVVVSEDSSAPRWYIGDRGTTREKYLSQIPLRALWITADHMRVVSGEPSERRDFLDQILSAAHHEYGRHLRDYRAAMMTRNRVLQDISEGRALRSDLTSWDTLLARHALEIKKIRKGFFEWIQTCPLGDPRLPGNTRTCLVERHEPANDSVESYQELLREYQERDIILRRTTIGPHRDDIGFDVMLDGVWRPQRDILSRGENKTVLLMLIRKTGAYIEHTSGKKPFFLLDDVLSELDETHSAFLLDTFRGTRTLITTQPNHTTQSTQNIPHLLLEKDHSSI